jgi:hypothetical protein
MDRNKRHQHGKEEAKEREEKRRWEIEEEKRNRAGNMLGRNSLITLKTPIFDLGEKIFSAFLFLALQHNINHYVKMANSEILE